MKKSVLVIIIILFVTRTAPIIGAVPFSGKLKEIGLYSYWLKLLHYEKNIFGNFSSLIDGPLFFFHPEGKNNPEGELRASILAFLNPELKVGYLKRPPQCVFPERYRFLKSAGLIKDKAGKNVKDIECKDFSQWKEGIGAQSVTLVFSSSFPNSPASMFGHTFIRFNQLNQKNHLLDYAASYAADTRADDGTVMYAIKGLFGGYKGFFGFNPYYMKVNEYNDSESRDLYEYDLNIPKEGVDRIINHLWELYSTTWFDYYFIDENCSYILARILELGRPKWNLSSPNRWYYLPNDTIKLLTRYSKAFKKISYRPSLEKKLQFRLSKLTKKELGQFHRIKAGEVVPALVENIKVLDTLIAYMNYKKNEKEKKLSEQENIFFRDILISRSKIGTNSIPLTASNFSQNKLRGRPDLAHDPQRITVSSGVENSNLISGLEFQIGFHDLLAYDAGMEPFSQIEGPKILLSYDWEEGRAKLEKLGVINVTSLHPVTFYNPEFSWKGKVNYETIKDFKCSDCHKLDFEGGAGGSISFGNKRGSHGIIYAMLGLYSEISKHYKRNYRIGPSLEWSCLLAYKRYKIRFFEILNLNVMDSIKRGYYLESVVSQSYALSKNWEVRLVNSFVSRYGGFKTQADSHILKLGFYF